MENGVKSTCVDISYKELFAWSFIEATICGSFECEYSQSNETLLSLPVNFTS